MYKRQVSGRRGNIRIFRFMGENISSCSCGFGFFGGFLHVFMMYSCRKSFRELKNAKINPFFLYLGGLGAKLSF